MADLPIRLQTEEEKIFAEINRLTHLEMATLWRNEPAGHMYFDMSLPYWKVFEKRWEAFGGWTPEVSKAVGRFV
jgi:hypothetical protein